MTHWLFDEDGGGPVPLDDPRLTAANPTPLAQRRSIDLVECPSCRTVQSIGDVETAERREIEVLNDRGKERGDTVDRRGVFCGVPGCGQLLFDEDGWIEHLADRRVFDRDQAADDPNGGIPGDAEAAAESSERAAAAARGDGGAG